MNKKYLKLIYLIAGLFFSFATYGQNNQKEKILGMWFFNKLEPVNKMEVTDSLHILNEVEGLIVTFNANGNYKAKRNKSSTGENLEGTYFVSEDGKKLVQNNEEAEILTLTNNELILKISNEVILYFEKGSKVVD